jgi:molybdopterin/thiamine biosynthesis adenylyltransferase
VSDSSRSTFTVAEFYSRQTVLSELGTKGQDKLRHSEVTIVGLGGLGSISTLFLALGGVGRLRLVDQDTVESNNLHRQALYSVSDLRYPKVEAAARRIKELNPEVVVETFPENLDATNVREIVGNSDCVVDGLDNMETRYYLNNYCVEKGIPFVFGGAIGLEGNVAVLKSPETACLQCILPGLNDTYLPTCDTRGVLGATTGIIGSLQALETVKVLANIEPESRGKLMIFDFAQSEFRILPLRVRPDCEVCQIRPAKALSPKRRLAWLCGSDTANVNPENSLSLNLPELSKSPNLKQRISLVTPMVLVFDFEGHEVSLFSKGRMLIKNVRNEKEAYDVYQSVAKILCLE